MQPLAYQVLQTSCWVTSMLNGIMLLNNGKHVPFMAYKLLHNLLVKEGVFYYNKEDIKAFEAIVASVGLCSNLKISWESCNTVEPCLMSLDYQHQLAVCDVGAGDHSILISGYENGIFQAFDPYWDSVKDCKSVKEEYEIFSPYMPKSGNSVNILIWKEHLFATKRNQDYKGYKMGAESMRRATILTQYR